MRGLWTRKSWSWYLYDFANSLFFVVVGLYFSQWVVVEKGMPDFYFALPFMIATALLIFVSPYVGELGDARQNHHRILLWMTILTILSGILLITSAKSGLVFVAIACYGAFQFFEQLALVPYTAFMKSVAQPKQYGAVSGIGYAFNEAGNIIGLLLSLLVIYGVVTMFGTGRISAIIPALIGFMIFVIPAFFLRMTGKARPMRHSLLSALWKNVKESRKRPEVFRLLLAFYFFSDALASVTLFAAIYLEKVLQVPDTMKVLMYVFVIVGMMAGAFAGGIVSDRLGHRRTTIISLLCTAIVIIATAFATGMLFIAITFTLFGVFSGAVYASSRAYLASLIPAKDSGKYFGLYMLSERFASILGPAIWSIIVWALKDQFPWNYRIAVLAMAALAACGLIPLLVRAPRTARSSA
jgi:MFS transporter, UMF1 family